MSQEIFSSEFPSTRAVERIREILVGESLDGIEERLKRLEEVGHGRSGEEARWLEFNARLLALESAVEAIMELVRGEELRRVGQMDELKKVAWQVRQATDWAAGRGEAAWMRDWESRMGHWMAHWQASVEAQLRSIEARWIDHIRREVEVLRESLPVPRIR